MDELTAAVVHDVKNQLAELALRLERRGDSAEETDIAFAAARRLTGLLLVQRQQAGVLRLNVDSACPADLLQELAAEYRALFPALDISLETEAAPTFWFYDAALLRLALGNAIHNACRHACGAVRLQAQQQDGRLEFAIADDGPGFPQEMLAQGLQLAPLPASRHGTGLGLYLAARIAELHQNGGNSGNIELRNGPGAIFLLRLP